MSDYVRRYLYVNICKHEVVLNLIKVEFFDDEKLFKKTFCIKVNVNESDISKEIAHYARSGLYEKIMILLSKIYVCEDLLKISEPHLEDREIRKKELDSMRKDNKDRIFFFDILDNTMFDYAWSCLDTVFKHNTGSLYI